MSNPNIWNPGASINANSSISSQAFTATEGQTDFTITDFQYTVGTNSLLVFVGSGIQRIVTDWVEVSSTEFSLVVGPPVGTVVYAVAFTEITSAIPVPLMGTPYVYPKVNAAGTGWDMLTAAEVLADIDAVPETGPAAITANSAQPTLTLTQTGAGAALALVGPLFLTTLGPDADSQHTVPDVASDTVALISAAQTLTNKTLTAPVINGFTGTGNGTVTGNLTVTGNTTLGDAEATDTHTIKGATTLLANSASAALTITQTGAGNAFVVEDSASTDSTPFVVTADGITLVGDSTARTIAALVPSFQVSGSGTAGFASIMRYSSPGAGGANLVLASSRGSAPGTFSAVTTGDGIGGLTISGDDGTSYVNNVGWARWSVESAVSTGVIPSYFHVAVMNAAGTHAERFRIASDGTTTLGGTSTAPALSVIPVASQVNYLYTAGSATGQSVSFGALGSDTNINVSYQTKGTGGFYFGTNAGSATQVQIQHTASANRYITLTGGYSADANPLLQNARIGVNGAMQVEILNEASPTRFITLKGSNGGNPTIGVSGGSLVVSAALLGSSYIHANNGTATPAGGSATAGVFMGSSTVGMTWGSGAPSHTMAAGSIYLRTDGGASTRLYSTSGGGTWHAITSA